MSNVHLEAPVFLSRGCNQILNPILKLISQRFSASVQGAEGCSLNTPLVHPDYSKLPSSRLLTSLPFSEETLKWKYPASRDQVLPEYINFITTTNGKVSQVIKEMNWNPKFFISSNVLPFTQRPEASSSSCTALTAKARGLLADRSASQGEIMGIRDLKQSYEQKIASLNS